MQFPEGTTRDQACGKVAREWGFSDANGAAAWLQTLVAGTARDSAIVGFVSAVDGHDPGLGTLWAATMTDPERRLRTVEGVAARWLQSDAPAARDWILGSDLPPEAKSRLMQAP